MTTDSAKLSYVGVLQFTTVLTGHSRLTNWCQPNAEKRKNCNYPNL